MIGSANYYRTIDIHTHMYTGREARALKKMFGQFNIDMAKKLLARDLSPKGLANAMLSSKVGLAVVLPVVTPSKSPNVTTNRVSNKLTWQYKNLNANRSLIGFGALHPDMEMRDIEHEAGRIKGYGWRGVKFHPPQQKFDPVSSKMHEIFSMLEENGLMALLDTWVDPERMDPAHALSPSKLQVILDSHPALTVIAAQMAGVNWWGIDNILGSLGRSSRLYLDTSSSHEMTPDGFGKLAERFGFDNILFGSDHPYHDMGEEIERVRGLGLSEPELNAVMHNNAQRLLRV